MTANFWCLSAHPAAARAPSSACLRASNHPQTEKFSIDGRPVSRERPGRRDVAMVFQSYALYPHLSVRDNLSFGLRRSCRRTLVQRLQDQLVDAAEAFLHL